MMNSVHMKSRDQKSDSAIDELIFRANLERKGLEIPQRMLTASIKYLEGFKTANKNGNVPSKIAATNRASMAGIIKRIERLQQEKRKLTLTPEEVEKIYNVCVTTNIYSMHRDTPSSEILLAECIKVCRSYYLDGSHTLDNKMDRKRDYSRELFVEESDFIAYHQHNPAKIKEYADTMYFSILACIEKLEQANAAKRGESRR